MKGNKSFRNLLLGITITNFGDSLFTIAVPIIIYAQTENSFYVSFSALMATIPIIFGFALGPLINNMISKKYLIGLQIIQMISISLIFGILFMGINGFNFVLILLGQLIFGFCNYITYILIQMYVPEIVEEKDLPKANGRILISRNIANGIADSLSGILISLINYLSIYIFDILTYFVTLFFYSRVEILPEGNKTGELKNNKKNIKEYIIKVKDGFKGVFSNSFVISILLVSILGQFQSKITIITAVGYFSEIGKSYYYGFYYSILLIGFSIGGLIAGKIKERISFSKFFIITFTLSGIIWTISILLLGEFGVLFATLLMAMLSGIFEILVITRFQILFKNNLGNVLTLFMAITGVSQILGLLIAPFLINFLGHSFVITWVSVFNYMAVFVYIVFVSTRKEKGDLIETDFRTRNY